MRARAARQTGTSAPTAQRRRSQPRIVGHDAVQPRQQPQGGAGVGRAAAEPGGDGDVLFQDKAPGLEAIDARAQRGRRLEHQIVGDGPARRGKGADDLQRRIAARLEIELVGERGESHQAFQFVIAVVAAAEHAQRQIDLGRSLFSELAHATA